MKEISDEREIALSDLPQYTHWIEYLLGLKTLSKSLDKNSESISREYGQDKWGVLLQRLRALKAPTVFDADALCTDTKKIPFFSDGKILFDDTAIVQDQYFRLIRDELQPYLTSSNHLVELGSGYGSIVFKLAELPEFASIKYTAGEFTDSGIACLELLANEIDQDFEAGFCDLNDLCLDQFDIVENAIFMTSWAMAYLKGLSRNTLNEIMLRKPKVVIHIEPIYEHWNEASLLPMLWRKYCQLNDYNSTLLTALKTYEAEGLIKIIEERKNVFGSNPLAPVSIVKWIPVRSQE